MLCSLDASSFPRATRGRKSSSPPRRASCRAASTARSARSRRWAPRRSSSSAARRAYRGRRRPHLHRLRDVVGPADPRSRAQGFAEGARGSRGEGHELRRADRARDASGPARRDAHAVDGARALRQLRHRSGDERGPRGARGDEARQDRQVRGLLSRPRGCVPRAGGLGGDDARRADESRRSDRAAARYAARALQRSRLGRTAVRSSTGGRSPPSSSSRSPATWGWFRHARGSSRACARSATAKARCSSSTK